MTIKQRAGKVVFKNLPFSKHVFDHVRLELNAILVRLKHKVNPFYRAKVNALKQKKDILLNLGCGPYGLPGEWINLDLFPITNVYLPTDCRKKLPLANDSCKGIHVEMFMEHLEPKDELPFFLKECFRVLQPYGVLRIIVPDASLFLKAYFEESWNRMNEISYGLEDWSKVYSTKMDALNHVFLQEYEHYGGWDKERMLFVLQQAGFNKIKFLKYGEGDFPGGVIDREYHKQNGLYTEATK
jgi:predicted SAM-dependent methyltransferase